jgi:hypothetical protein
VSVTGFLGVGGGALCANNEETERARVSALRDMLSMYQSGADPRADPRSAHRLYNKQLRVDGTSSTGALFVQAAPATTVGRPETWATPV